MSTTEPTREPSIISTDPVEISNATIPTAPEELEDKGIELWESIHSVFDFSDEPAKVAVLEEACRVRDLIHRLETTHKQQGMSLTATGSARQMTIHPIIAEVRSQRGTLNQLLRSLGLPDSDEATAAKAEKRTRAAKIGANARWGTSS